MDPVKLVWRLLESPGSSAPYAALAAYFEARGMANEAAAFRHLVEARLRGGENVDRTHPSGS